MKIRSKLIICFLIPAIFTLLLGVVSYQTASDIIIENYESSISQSIRSTSNYFMKVFDTIKFKANQLCSDTSMKSYYTKGYEFAESEEKYDAFVVSFKNMSTQDVYSVSMIPRQLIEIFTQGSYTSTVIDEETYDSMSTIGNSYWEKFLTTEEGQNFYNSDAYFEWKGTHEFLDSEIGIGKDKYGLCLVRKFTDLSGSTIGYLSLDVRMTAISKVLESVDLPEGSRISLISSDGRELCYHKDYIEKLSDGRVLVDNRDVTSLENVGMDAEDMISMQDFYMEDITGEDTSGYRYVTYQGEEQLFFFEKLSDDTGAIVCALVPKDVITQQADSIADSSVVMLGLAIVVALGFGFFVSRNFSKAIKKVVIGMDKVATGDLSVQLTTKRKDEFKNLTDSANHMIGNTRVLIDKVSKVSSDLHESSGTMKENTGILLETSNNIVSAIDEIQKGILHQASDTEECTNISQVLEDRIKVVADHVTSIEKVVHESSESVETGIHTIASLSEIVDDTVKVTKITIDNMSALHEESNNIGEIVHVINDIAEQTNLLSLNASIEAARAGESGRGFMVVAEEIRKLAELSKQSASKIGDIIQRIQVKTNQTAHTVRSSEALMEKEQMELSRVIDQFKQIDTSVRNMVMNLEDITSGVIVMEQSKDQTIKAIQGISQVAEESAASTEEVNATANEQLTAVDSLNQAAKHLAIQAEELRTEISKFIV